VRRGLGLVAEEEIDVLPLPILLAGGGRRVGGLRGLGLAEGEVPELEARRAGTRVLLDQGIDRLQLVVVAARALKVREQGDRDRRIARAEVRAVLLDARNQLLGLLAAADRDLLRTPLADRKRDDRREQAHRDAA